MIAVPDQFKRKRPLSWLLFGIGVIVAVGFLGWPYYAPMMVRAVLAAALPDQWQVSFDTMQADFTASRLTGLNILTPQGVQLEAGTLIVSHPITHWYPKLEDMQVALRGGRILYRPVIGETEITGAGGNDRWLEWLDQKLPGPEILPINRLVLDKTQVMMPDQFVGEVIMDIRRQAGGTFKLDFMPSDKVPASGRSDVSWSSDGSLSGNIEFDAFSQAIPQGAVMVRNVDLDFTIPAGSLLQINARFDGLIEKLDWMSATDAAPVTFSLLRLDGTISGSDRVWQSKLSGNFQNSQFEVSVQGALPKPDALNEPTEFALTGLANLAGAAPFIPVPVHGKADFKANGQYQVQYPMMIADWSLDGNGIRFGDLVNAADFSLSGSVALKGDAQHLTVKNPGKIDVFLADERGHSSVVLNRPITVDLQRLVKDQAVTLVGLDIGISHPKTGQPKGNRINIQGDIELLDNQYDFDGELRSDLDGLLSLPIDLKTTAVADDQGAIKGNLSLAMPQRPGFPTIKAGYNLNIGRSIFLVQLPKTSIDITSDWFGNGQAKLPKAFQNWIGSATGRLVLAATVSGTAQKQQAEILISGDFSDFELFGLIGRGLSFTDQVSLDSDTQYITSDAQGRLSFTDLQIAEGYSLKSFKTDWRWLGDRLSMQPIQTDFLGAALVTSPFEVILAQPNFSTNLRMEGLKLAAFSDLLDVGGLSATGVMNGAVDINYANNMITLADGSFTAEGGKLQYLAGFAPGQVAQEATLAFDVLEDFQYDSLTMSLNGALGGEQTATLRLIGRNPAVYDGYPVDLNINLSGALDAIAQRSLDALTIPDRLQELLQPQ